jgi:putative spermidine/putrescine transport system permease protein
MISWIPFLGREGILNDAVMATHLVNQPLDFLLFSDFAVVVAYVHIFTMMMVAPIVNSMAKIDRGLIAAARDAGATEAQIVRDIVIPLSKTGIVLGSVLVLTQVMGDFFIVHVLSGGKSAGVVSGIENQLNAFEYPPAAASSVILLIIVVALVIGIFSLVDVRKELAG